MIGVSPITSSYLVDSAQPVEPQASTKALPDCNLPYKNDPYFANRYVKMTYSQCQELASLLADLAIKFSSAGQLGSARHKMAEKQLINQYFASINI